MKEKILLYVDNWFLHFAVGLHIQKKLDCEIFGAIDIDEKAKPFFQNQDLLQFKNTWYLRDTFTISDDYPDLEYLKNFEKQNKIKLWDIIYSDKTFYSDVRYKFSSNQILSLVEKECKLFEKILNESKPDYFFTMVSTNHYQRLLYELCKSKQIPILMLTPVKFARRLMISESTTEFDKNIKSSKNNLNIRSVLELQNYLKDFDPSHQIKELEKKAYTNNSFQRYNSIFKFFITPESDYSKKYYSHYGVTKNKIFWEKLKRFLKRKYRQSFIDKHSVKTLDVTQPFVYYPLHYEPERILLVDARFYDNQISVISNISKSLPVGYSLFVKEHPMMKTVGWRSTLYYKTIMNLPNVHFIHPSITSEEIIKKCSLVVTIAGTTGQEAAFYGKPVILFTDQLYSQIPFVKKLDKIDDLPALIDACLNEKPDISTLNEFVNLINENSFEFDLQHIAAEFGFEFGYKGPRMSTSIQQEKLKSFLDKYSGEFKQLTEEHLKKLEILRKSK